ncbi:unnamed protein product [marine sediment metagenome]|uniref:Uncharacterized protein n=1 Tax=marine sediment metagenome TaxID=412755 RepID=X0V6W6_9ZZZZ
MNLVYKPHNRFESDVDPERCKAAVHVDGRGVGFHQCLRKPWKDGWCRQHHPDSVRKRNEAAQAKYDAEQKVSNERWRLHDAAKGLLEACLLLLDWYDSTDAPHEHLPPTQLMGKMRIAAAKATP